MLEGVLYVEMRWLVIMQLQFVSQAVESREDSSASPLDGGLGLGFARHYRVLCRKTADERQSGRPSLMQTRNSIFHALGADLDDWTSQFLRPARRSEPQQLG